MGPEVGPISVVPQRTQGWCSLAGSGFNTAVKVYGYIKLSSWRGRNPQHFPCETCTGCKLPFSPLPPTSSLFPLLSPQPHSGGWEKPRGRCLHGNFPRAGFKKEKSHGHTWAKQPTLPCGVGLVRGCWAPGKLCLVSEAKLGPPYSGGQAWPLSIFKAGTPPMTTMLDFLSFPKRDVAGGGLLLE